jgi:hypothetical protein
MPTGPKYAPNGVAGASAPHENAVGMASDEEKHRRSVVYLGLLAAFVQGMNKMCLGTIGGLRRLTGCVDEFCDVTESGTRLLIMLCTNTALRRKMMMEIQVTSRYVCLDENDQRRDQQPVG